MLSTYVNDGMLLSCPDSHLYKGKPKNTLDQTGPYQVDSNSTAKQEAQVDVDGVVLVLNNPGQTTNNGTDNEGEDQQRLQQLG